MGKYGGLGAVEVVREPPARAEPRYIRAAEDELRRWPGVTWGYVHRTGNHPLIHVEFKGKHRRHGIATTTVSQQGPLHFRKDLRRMLLDLGAERRSEPRVQLVASKPRQEKRAQNGGACPANKQERPMANNNPRPRPVFVENGLPNPLDPFDVLKDLHAGMTREAMRKWDEYEINAERLDEAARLLIEGWHPEIVKRAAEMIRAVQSKERRL